MDDLAIAWRPLGELIPVCPQSAHPSDAQVAQIAASIREFGWTNPVLVDGRNGIIAGHGRVLAARKLGLERVPVIELAHMSEAQKRAYVPGGQPAGAERRLGRGAAAARAGAISRELGFDLGLIGFGAGELERLLAGGEGGPDRRRRRRPPLPGQAVTQPGDLWVLGDHRLLCGDATVLADVERVLGGQLADMTFDRSALQCRLWQSAKDRLRGKIGRSSTTIWAQALSFLRDACANILSVTKGACYVCMSSSELHTLQRAFRRPAASGRALRHLGEAHLHARPRRLPAAVRAHPLRLEGGADHYWCGARDQGDVWHFDKPARNDLHPTMKPVALVERAIRNSSKPRDIVLDPFGGSGSTLIACESDRTAGAARGARPEVLRRDRAALAGRGQAGWRRWRATAGPMKRSPPGARPRRRDAGLSWSVLWNDAFTLANAGARQGDLVLEDLA